MTRTQTRQMLESNTFHCAVCEEAACAINFPAYYVMGERICKDCAYSAPESEMVSAVYPDGKVAKGI